MAVSIWAFNSLELNDQELMEDGLNLLVDWELSTTFGDLLLSRDITLDEVGELDQIASILNVAIEPLYKMSNYWDKEQEEIHLSMITDEVAKAKQLAIIQQNNSGLIGNIDEVYATITSLEDGILKADDLKYILKKINSHCFNDYRYFSKERRPYGNYLLDDILKIKEFIEFVKPLDGDTVYFKFKTSN